MKRVVWGIVIGVFGILCFASAGQNPGGPAGSIVMGLLCVAGGGLLIYFGARYLRDRKAVAEAALQMLREHNAINAGQVAQRLAISEVDARQYLADAQRRGIIPFKADIV
jgi:threonine/homoserine/homoserine lactone efflux protein